MLRTCRWFEVGHHEPTLTQIKASLLKFVLGQALEGDISRLVQLPTLLRSGQPGCKLSFGKSQEDMMSRNFAMPA